MALCACMSVTLLVVVLHGNVKMYVCNTVLVVVVDVYVCVPVLVVVDVYVCVTVLMVQVLVMLTLPHRRTTWLLFKRTKK